MRRAGGVGVILLLALGVFAVPAYAQDSGGGRPPSEREKGFRLQQNWPNPFNPETKFPFELTANLFEGDRPVRVTIQIYNVLQQLVASPVALNHAEGEREVVNLEYTTPGLYEAYWQGKDKNGQKVASGVYYVVMRVGGTKQVRKITVAN